MRATVWLTVGPEWPSRSAIRARSGTMPSSSSSKIVRRYISVVSMRSVTCHSLSSVPNTILWLRRDLRLADHPALVAAHEAAVRRVRPAAVRARPHALGVGRSGAAGLARLLPALPVRAVRRRAGHPARVTGARCCPGWPARSARPASTSAPSPRRSAGAATSGSARRWAATDVTLEAAGTPYAVGPGTLTTGGGTPYQVFTPFARAWRAHGWPRPAAVPGDLRWVRRVDSEDLPEVGDGVPDLPRRRRAGRARALARVPRRGHRRLRRAP